MCNIAFSHHPFSGNNICDGQTDGQIEPITKFYWKIMQNFDKSLNWNFEFPKNAATYKHRNKLINHPNIPWITVTGNTLNMISTRLYSKCHNYVNDSDTGASLFPQLNRQTCIQCPCTCCMHVYWLGIWGKLTEADDRGELATICSGFTPSSHSLILQELKASFLVQSNHSNNSNRWLILSNVGKQEDLIHVFM